MLAMIGLTLAVWLLLYARRLHWMFANDIEPNRLKTPRQRDALIPEHVNYASFNFQNLFELPVIFYALCLLLYVTDSVGRIDVGLAWTFVAARIVHSAVHVTFNDVRLRFGAYVVGAIALWAMFARTVLAAI